MKTSALALLTASFFSITGSAPAQQPDVRVRIIHTMPEVSLQLAGSWNFTAADTVTAVDSTTVTLSLGTGGLVATFPDSTVTVPEGSILRVAPASVDSSVLIPKVPYGIGWWWEATEDRKYSCPLEFRVGDPGVIQGVAAQPLEDYLRGVVPSEIGADSPLEALKAQAVAARSETVRALRNRVYAGSDYDICADVECQAYSGDTKRSAKSDQAIAETASLVLFHGEEVIGAYYASSCGGHSEDVENVWPERSVARPYWSGHLDSESKDPVDLTTNEGARTWIDSSPESFCNPAYNAALPAWSKKNFRWERTFKVADLNTLWADRGIGEFKSIVPLRRGVSGRIVEARIEGTTGSFTTSRELELRQLFGPPLRSSCFYVVGEGTDEIKIVGAGWGHGVGMCQTGAVGRAMMGQDFRQILTHYYRETEIKPAY